MFLELLIKFNTQILPLIYKILFIAAPFVVPIILSIMFLPPLLKGVFDQYKDILGVGADGGGASAQDLLKSSAGNFDLNNLDLNKLPPQVRALLNK